MAGPVFECRVSSCAAAAGSILAWAFNLGRKPGLRLDYQRRIFHNFKKGTVMAYLTAGNGWKSLIAAIAVYEVVCAEDELLSHGVDRLLVKHPVWPRVAVFFVAFHLVNWLPARFDPLALSFHVTRFVGRSERLRSWGKRATVL